MCISRNHGTRTYGFNVIVAFLIVGMPLTGAYHDPEDHAAGKNPEGIVYVSGEIASGTTWTSNNVYIVVGDVAVSDLTIEPGTVVRFDPGTYMWVQQFLHAVGTANNRIVFTSNSTSPGPGDWGRPFEAGIFFANCGEESVIQYAVIEYGRGIGVVNCAPRILDNILRYNYGDVANGSAITVRHDNGGYPTMRIVVSRNQVVNNVGSFGCSGGGAIAILSGVAVITDNAIIDNWGGCAGGITFNSLDRYHIGSRIENNRIWSNVGYIVGGLIVESNDGRVSYPGGNVIVRRNSIANNIAFASADNQYQSSGGLRLLSPEIVSENTIVNNTSNSTWYPGDDNGGVTLLSRANVQSTISDNNIAGGHETYVLSVMGQRDVDARNNFWVDVDEQDLPAQIYDGNDHWSLGFAQYQPILEAPVETAPGFLWQITVEESDLLRERVTQHTLTFAFSRPMNTLFSPQVSFGIQAPYDSFIISGGQWIDERHWRAIYDSSQLNCGRYITSVSEAKGTDGLKIPPDTSHAFVVSGNCRLFLPTILHWSP